MLSPSELPIPELFNDKLGLFIYTLNRYGDNILPCLTPLVTRNLVIPPYEHILSRILVYQYVYNKNKYMYV